MNLIERTFKEYLETFHSMLSQTATKYFETNLTHKLLHLSFLPAQITGYVSTKFGIGFEYIPAKETRIKIVIGGKRVENLLSNPAKSLLDSRTFFKVDGSDVGISKMTLETGIYLPFKLLKETSSVFINDVCLETYGRKRIITYAELYGDNKVENWTREKAIIRAKDEVLAAVVELNRSQSKKVSLDKYISVYKKRTVLLLGDYDNEGLKRLQVIEDVLKEMA